MNTIAILELANLVMTLISSASVNMQRYREMVAQSPNGKITRAQMEELVKDRDEAIAKL